MRIMDKIFFIIKHKKRLIHSTLKMLIWFGMELHAFTYEIFGSISIGFASEKTTEHAKNNQRWFDQLRLIDLLGLSWKGM